MLSDPSHTIIEGGEPFKGPRPRLEVTGLQLKWEEKGMGSQQGKFKEEHMKEFEATTPFNRAEMYHIFKVFQQLYEAYSRKEDGRWQQLLLLDDHYINTEAALPTDHICEHLPALRANPFREKMCDIFSVSTNGMMTFVEFVDMISAFSPKNSIQQKIFHAFQIFDDDGDGIINHDDLSKMLDQVTDKRLDPKKKDLIITAVFEEVNKDSKCDGLSTEDFHYAISRSPDFARVLETVSASPDHDTRMPLLKTSYFHHALSKRILRFCYYDAGFNFLRHILGVWYIQFSAVMKKKFFQAV